MKRTPPLPARLPLTPPLSPKGEGVSECLRRSFTVSAAHLQRFAKDCYPKN